MQRYVKLENVYDIEDRYKDNEQVGCSVTINHPDHNKIRPKDYIYQALGYDNVLAYAAVEKVHVDKDKTVLETSFFRTTYDLSNLPPL